jgi:hypothetical protein
MGTLVFFSIRGLGRCGALHLENAAAAAGAWMLAQTCDFVSNNYLSPQGVVQARLAGGEIYLPPEDGKICAGLSAHCLVRGALTSKLLTFTIY